MKQNSSLYMRCFKDTNIPSTLPSSSSSSSPSLPHSLPPPSSHYCIDAVTSLGGDVTGSVELEHPYQRQGDEREPFWPLWGVKKRLVIQKKNNNTHTQPTRVTFLPRRGEAGQGRPGGGWACRVLDAVGARWVEPEPFSWRGEAGSWCLTWRRIIKRSSTTNTVCTQGSETWPALRR